VKLLMFEADLETGCLLK